MKKSGSITCKFCGKTGHYKYQCREYLLSKPKTPAKPPKSRSKAVKRKTRVNIPRKTTTSRKELINRLDGVVSKYVRLKYASPRGIVHCYTCGKPFHWKEVDNGHFWSRRYMPTRFDPKNCRPQCKTCNRVLSGNYEVYSKKMLLELGQEEYDNLEKKAKSGEKISTPMLEFMLERAEESLLKLQENRK